MKTNAMNAIAIRAAAAAAPIDGLVKAEAARFLGCSIRQVERLAKAGHVRRKVLPKGAGERVALALYSRADLERVKHGERPAKVARVVGSSPKPIVKTAGAVDLLLAALALPSTKPWLSIPKASKFSGLSPAFLRARAPELARIGAAVNVGRGDKPRWRLLRSQLEKGFPPAGSI